MSAQWWDTAAAITGGRWLLEPGAEARGAAIDTRVLCPGNMFFALRGTRTDGHMHVPDAARAGAAYAVIEDGGAIGEIAALHAISPAFGVLMVENVRGAMAALARVHRETLRGRVIAVTGSVGKTTTVRLIDAALASTLQGSAPTASFNNELGVPLTILNAEPGDDYLVCEIGTSAPGEIGALASIVRPDICVITGVGRAHVARFGSIAAIACEKASLAAHLRPGGCAIVNGDQALLLSALAGADAGRTPATPNSSPATPNLLPPSPRVLGGQDARPTKAAPHPSPPPQRGGGRRAGPHPGHPPHAGEEGDAGGTPATPNLSPAAPGGGAYPARVRTFGFSAQADVRIACAAQDGSTLRVDLADDACIDVPLVGRHNALNAALALGVARELGVNDASAVAGMRQCMQAPMRLSVEELPGGVRLIDDAYNASPESMLGALDALCDVGADHARRVAVLGEMFELGDHARGAHMEVVRKIMELPISLALLVGPAYPKMRATVPQCIINIAHTDDDSVHALAEHIHPGDAVLVKGSRAARMERVCEAVRLRFAGASAVYADNT